MTKPKRGRGRPPQRRNVHRLSANIDVEIGERLTRAVERRRQSIRVVVEDLLSVALDATEPQEAA